MVRSIGKVFEEISALHDLMNSASYLSVSPNVCNPPQICPNIDIQYLAYLRNQVLKTLGTDYEVEFWTADDFYIEHRHNTILSECGAACLLISEITSAISYQVESLNRCITDLTLKHSITSRRRKQAIRIISLANVALNLYSLTISIAFLFLLRRLDDAHDTSLILTDSQLMNVIRRSRMVVSTYSASSNADRAQKALSQFIKCKEVKSSILH